MTYEPMAWLNGLCCLQSGACVTSPAQPPQAVLPTVVAKLTDQLVQEWAMLLGQLQVRRTVCNAAVVMALAFAIAYVCSRRKCNRAPFALLHSQDSANGLLSPCHEPPVA